MVVEKKEETNQCVMRQFSHAFLIGSFLACVAVLLGVAHAINIPTQVTTTAAATILTQSEYQWYENADALTPTISLAAETTATGTPAAGSVIRLRMNVKATSLPLATGATFTLQYSTATSSGFTNVSTSTAWIFFDNPSVADGQTIVTTVLSTSNTGESYNESNPTAASPNAVSTGEKGEWDWVIKNNSAATSSNWYFRMLYSSGTVFDAYSAYPALTAVSSTPAPVVSPPVTVGVGGGYGLPGPPLLPPGPAPAPFEILQCADLNHDNRVDIIDLSILLYYYGQSGLHVALFECNGDLVIDFIDVSIMMYYWTE